MELRGQVKLEGNQAPALEQARTYPFTPASSP